ncbi:MAG: hypothetical protein O3A00_15240 [Planctomycetota bacterium]|nr:hypothetical protein [Planctomycetota bacterium]
MTVSKLEYLSIVLGGIGLSSILAGSLWAEDGIELKTGISASEFQKEFDQRLRDGFRLVDVSLYTVRRQTAMACIWGKRTDPEFHVQTKLTAPELQKHAQDVQPMGFQLVRVSANAAGSDVRYAGIWEKRKIPVHVRLGYDVKQFEEAHKTLSAAGSQPLHFHVVAVKGQLIYSGIWEDVPEIKRELDQNLSYAAFVKAIPERAAAGFRVLQVCGYPVGRGDRYCCVWEKTSPGEQQVSLRLTEAGLARAITDMQARGLQASRINSYPQGGANRFSVVWEAGTK